jgi:hypothetical protein
MRVLVVEDETRMVGLLKRALQAGRDGRPVPVSQDSHVYAGGRDKRAARRLPGPLVRLAGQRPRPARRVQRGVVLGVAARIGSRLAVGELHRALALFSVAFFGLRARPCGYVPSSRSGSTRGHPECRPASRINSHINPAGTGWGGPRMTLDRNPRNPGVIAVLSA